MVRLWDTLDVDQCRHLSAAFPNLYDDVCPTGEHTRLIPLLGQQRDGLIDASRGGVIECLQESTSLFRARDDRRAGMSDGRPVGRRSGETRFQPVLGVLPVTAGAQAPSPVLSMLTSLHILYPKGEMQANPPLRGR